MDDPVRQGVQYAMCCSGASTRPHHDQRDAGDDGGTTRERRNGHVLLALCGDFERSDVDNRVGVRVRDDRPNQTSETEDDQDNTSSVSPFISEVSFAPYSMTCAPSAASEHVSCLLYPQRLRLCWAHGG